MKAKRLKQLTWQWSYQSAWN